MVTAEVLAVNNHLVQKDYRVSAHRLQVDKEGRKATGSVESWQHSVDEVNSLQ